MANDKTTTSPGMVQCPVCFRDFRAATINGHLDACLGGSVADSSQCEKPRELEPPLKKPRVTTEPYSIFTAVNTADAGSSSKAAVFSFFQTNKSKVPAPGDTRGVASSKQAAAANRGLKRNVPNDVEPGTAGTSAQVSGPNGDTVKASQSASRRSLLTLNKPLAETLRPNTLEEYFGQNKVIGQQTLFRSLLDSQEIPSLVLWGPPGCGKVGEWPECSISTSRSLFPLFLYSYIETRRSSRDAFKSLVDILLCHE